MNDPYVLPNGVLRNRLGITDAVALATAEADITRARLLEVDRHPPPGDFDLTTCAVSTPRSSAICTTGRANCGRWT
ncbi:hypothetical protein GCM10017771_88090 [Streptomyces capitiformicae]|uniref:Uncharacterized protein n=1 Tax=Streptomyces capitiformicae TaxID=2014920 RepID=A0A919DMW0_9ACTN|nr:hypothetical protein GCM10017771_88090 [Streptomyces capitiformicae]